MALSSQSGTNENDEIHRHAGKREVSEEFFMDKMRVDTLSGPLGKDILKSRSDNGIGRTTTYQDTLITSPDVSESREGSGLAYPKNWTSYQDASPLKDKEGDSSKNHISINMLTESNSQGARNQSDIGKSLFSNEQPTLFVHDILANPADDRVRQEETSYYDAGIDIGHEEEKKNRTIDEHSKETKSHQPIRPYIMKRKREADSDQPIRPDIMKRKREADSDQANKRLLSNDYHEESADFPWMGHQQMQAHWKSSLISSNQHGGSDVIVAANHSQNIESTIGNYVERGEGIEMSMPITTNISISSPLISSNNFGEHDVKIDLTHTTPIELGSMAETHVTTRSMPINHREYSSLGLHVSEKLVDSVDVHKGLTPPQEYSCESSFSGSGISTRGSHQYREMYPPQQVDSFSSSQHSRENRRNEIYPQESSIPDRVVAASSSSQITTYQQPPNDLTGSSTNASTTYPILADDNRADSLHSDNSLAENFFDSEHYALSYEEDEEEEENNEESLANVTKSARSLSLPLARRLATKETDYKALGKRKINIQFIEDKNRRHITFSKRKAGIMKKAFELSTLTGTQVLLLVASETGHIYTFATPKLQPIITKPDGKALIQTCLNSTDIDETSSSNTMTTTTSHFQKHHDVMMMEKSTTSLDSAKGTLMTSGRRKCALPPYLTTGSDGFPSHISSSINMYSSGAGHYNPKTWSRAYHHPTSRNHEAIGSVHRHLNDVNLIKTNINAGPSIVGNTVVAHPDVAELMPVSTSEHQVERPLLNSVVMGDDPQDSSIHSSKRTIRKSRECPPFSETVPSHSMEQEIRMNRNHDSPMFSSSKVMVGDLNSNVVVERHLQDLEYLRDHHRMSEYPTSSSYESNIGSTVDNTPTGLMAIPSSSSHHPTISNATSQAYRWIPSSIGPSHHPGVLHRNPPVSISSTPTHTLSQTKPRK